VKLLGTRGQIDIVEEAGRIEEQAQIGEVVEAAVHSEPAVITIRDSSPLISPASPSLQARQIVGGADPRRLDMVTAVAERFPPRRCACSASSNTSAESHGWDVVHGYLDLIRAVPASTE
jgi:hypothetical protein